MKKMKIRDSNFELLRILAMVLIVFHHIIVHVLYNQLSSEYIYGPGQMFNNFIFYKRLIICEYGAIAGKVGNALFVLLTGYFICGNKSFKIDSKVKKLIGYTLFGSIVLFITSICYGYFIDNTIKNLETINLFNSCWWFIGYYLLIIVIGKYIINKYIGKFKQNEYKTLLLIMFAIISFGWSRGILMGFSGELGTLTTGLFYYCLGGYIKKYELYKNIRMKHLVTLLFVLLIVSALNYRSVVLSDIYTKLASGAGSYYQYKIYSSEYDIFTISFALVLFGIFSKIKIDNNKIINYISSSTLLVYIIHDCEFTRYVMKSINFVYLLHEDMAMFYIYIAIMISIIFIIGVVINLVYNFVINRLKNRITI